MKNDLILIDGDLAEQNNEDYSYSFGLVSAMQSKFLTKRDFEIIAMAANVKDVLTALEKTEYGPELEKISIGFSDFDLENAVSRSFMRTYRQVSNSIPEKDRKILDDLILGETDFKNIKSIVRGISHGLSVMDLKAMLSLGSFSTEKIEKMVESKSLEELALNLEDDVKQGFESSLNEYRNLGSIIPIEMALDRMLIEKWLSNSGMKEYVKLRIDLLNILNVFRCRASGIPLEKHLIPNGLNLSEQFLKSFEAMTPSEISAALAQTHYSMISKALQRDSTDILKLEQALGSLLKQEVDLKATISPLSLWTLVSYLNLKQKEAAKVKMILLLKNHNYPNEKIKEISM